MDERFYKIGNQNKRICLLTDLHFDIKDYDLTVFDKILNSLNSNKPDFICLSGDIIDNPFIIYDDKMNTLKDFIIKLSKIAQVIISLGNHDIMYKKTQGNFNDVNDWFLNLNKLENVYYLNNKNLVRDNLCFIGFNPDYKYYMYEDKRYYLKEPKYLLSEIDKLNINKNYYNILLCHSPIHIFKKYILENSNQIKKVDLILSGHMHNGLVPKLLDIKGTRGIVGPYYIPLPKYARGVAIKQLDKTLKMVISGGIIKFSNTTKKITRKLNILYPISIIYIDV